MKKMLYKKIVHRYAINNFSQLGCGAAAAAMGRERGSMVPHPLGTDNKLQ